MDEPIPLAELRKEPWYTAMYEKQTEKTKRRDFSHLREKGMVNLGKQNRVWPRVVCA